MSAKIIEVGFCSRRGDGLVLHPTFRRLDFYLTSTNHLCQDQKMPTNPQDLTTLVNLLIMVVIVLVLVLIVSLSQIGVKGQRRFEQWKARELQNAKQELDRQFQISKQELNRALAAEYEVKMLQWRDAHEANIRADAIIGSSAVIRGRVSKHLAPYIRFPHNPRDARFIGSPIDIIVFNGLEDRYLREIVFLEVKTGDGATLSPKQRQIRDIQDKKVTWCEFRV
jgi:predicted Holliday junction resolvase-like endonuclease